MRPSIKAQLYCQYTRQPSHLHSFCRINDGCGGGTAEIHHHYICTLFLHFSFELSQFLLSETRLSILTHLTMRKRVCLNDRKFLAKSWWATLSQVSRSTKTRTCESTGLFMPSVLWLMKKILSWIQQFCVWLQQEICRVANTASLTRVQHRRCENESATSALGNHARIPAGGDCVRLPNDDKFPASRISSKWAPR